MQDPGFPGERQPRHEQHRRAIWSGFTPPSWWPAMSRYSRRLTTPRKVRRAVLRTSRMLRCGSGFPSTETRRAVGTRDRLRGSRRRHTLCLIHLPPVLLLCVFGSTFQSLVVVAVCASKSSALRRSSKLPRQSQFIRAELSSNLSQSSFGCLRQDSIPVSWVEHHCS